MSGDLNFIRFADLNKEYIKRDYQIHTTWTDGSHSSLEVIDAAKKMGLKSIAFTEHIRRESEYFSDFYKEVDDLRKQNALEIFIGVETKVIDLEGNLDISQRDYDRAEIVLGSVHRIPFEGELIHPKKLGRDKTLELEFNYSLAMIKAGKIDVLSHPMGMSLRMYNVFSSTDLETLISKIASTSIAFEFNSKYTNPQFLEILVSLCRKYNPFVSIGSDVHKMEELGRCNKMLEAIL